jgi:predicted  nucleic acid-binding Zn-ribbon protein
VEKELLALKDTAKSEISSLKLDLDNTRADQDVEMRKLMDALKEKDDLKQELDNALRQKVEFENTIPKLEEKIKALNNEVSSLLFDNF